VTLFGGGSRCRIKLKSDVKTLHLATEIIECLAKSSLFMEEKIAALEIAKLALEAEGVRVGPDPFSK
jgi:hypothetical protein